MKINKVCAIGNNSEEPYINKIGTNVQNVIEEGTIKGYIVK